MSESQDTIVSYSVGGLAYLASHICLTDVVSLFMQIGSVILLLSRLYIDVPKAWHKWRKRGQ